MTPPPNQDTRAKQIFNEAIERVGLEREAYLNQAAGGDAALRARVRSLLEASERPDSFLRDPTISLAEPKSREGPGMRIGPYRILQLIGEGGFGSVYMAEQSTPVLRRVALKIIKLGMDTRQVVARFEAERQALAMMDHPHIAKVLDGGATDAGRPYFVMELVKGETITHFCDRNGLSIPERLELLLQVCEAVQHAHQKGIIHRDIKPSNVLVNTQDGRPFARVIDFGIAKATAARLTEKTLFTEHRSLIGTPEYMSPEQAEGGPDIDTRTDVYSLGVLLYELLTGSTPFRASDLRSAAFGEIQRIIREVEPEKPSTRLSHSMDTLASVAARRKIEPARLGKLVRGELDWIVMKSLEKNRSRRYATPGDLGADLRRFLIGEAVSASPPSRTYRARKFIGRHRAGVTAAAMVAVALFIGAIGTGVFAYREAQARARAQSAEAAARQRAGELERVVGFQDAQLSGIDPNEFGVALRKDLLSETRAALKKAQVPEEETQSQVAALQSLLARTNLTNIAMRMLDAGLFDRSVRAVNEQFKDQPLVRARLLQTLADSMTHLGLLDRAIAPQTEALEIRRNLLGNEHEDTLTSVGNAAELLRQRGRMAEAVPLFEEAYTTSRRVLGDNHRVTLAAVTNMGSLRWSEGKLDEAEKLDREAVDMSRRILGEDHPDTAGALSNLAFVLGQKNQLPQALELMRQALAIRRKALGDAHHNTAQSVNNLAFMLVDNGKAGEAESLFRESYESRRKLLGDDHPDTITSVNNIGSALRAQSKLIEAEKYFRQSMEARRRILGPDHQDTITAISNLGVCLHDLGRDEEAAPMYREAFERRRAILGPEHQTTISSMSNMGVLLESMDKLDEAEPYVRGAYEARLRILGPDAGETLLSESNWAYLLQRKHNLAEAEPLYREVLEKRLKAVGPAHPRTLTSMHLLATLLRDKGDLPGAEQLFTEALEGRIQALGPSHAAVADSRFALARTLLEQSKFAGAEREALAAQKLFEPLPGASAFKSKRSIELLADLYSKWNAAEPGKGYDAKAEEWKGRIPPK